MASATATATRAAAGFDFDFDFDKRASAACSLQTPGSGGFPSELRSPMACSPSFVKQRENELKTPITPPSAYLDFLKNMSPAMMSPAPTGTSARFSFNEKNSDKTSESSGGKLCIGSPRSQPALSRNTSYDSTTSTATASTDRSNASSVSAASTSRQRPESPRVIIPPSPFAKPAPRSARTPRRLHIPQSPAFTPALSSAHSVPSPYASTPLSAAPWSASFENKDADTEANGKPGRVSVKQVVTRTVTYCRTPLEPEPNGNLWKRRKIEQDDAAFIKAPLCEPTIKEEEKQGEEKGEKAVASENTDA